MRAWEPEPGESAKAFRAFKLYRDMGSERSLARTAETYYGSRSNLAQIRVWSSKFHWVARVRAYDAWLEMVANDAIERYQQEKATEFAARQARIREKWLEAAEVVADNMLTMAQYPLTKKKVIERYEDGKEKTVHLQPVRWSKTTLAHLNQVLISVLMPGAVDDGEDDDGMTDMDRTIARWEEERAERASRRDQAEGDEHKL